MLGTRLGASKRTDGETLRMLLRSGNETAITMEILRDCVKSPRAAQAVSKHGQGLKIQGSSTGLITGELVAAAFGDRSSHYTLINLRGKALLDDCKTYGSVFTTLALSDYPQSCGLVTKFAKQHIAMKDPALYLDVMENASLPQLNGEKSMRLEAIRISIMNDLEMPGREQLGVLGRLSARNTR